MTDKDRTAIIRRLNDQLRRHHIGGHVMVTQGIKALGPVAVAEILAEIARFDSFNADNDPYEEHDCAIVNCVGERVIWKIDYYDRMLTFGSPDPADPTVTERVMTAMLAKEY
jgi:Protein of unknown function (DUF3768)